MVTHSSGTLSGLKILVSAVRFCPWPHFPSLKSIRFSQMFSVYTATRDLISSSLTRKPCKVSARPASFKRSGSYLSAELARINSANALNVKVKGCDPISPTRITKDREKYTLKLNFFVNIFLAEFRAPLYPLAARRNSNAANARPVSTR